MFLSGQSRSLHFLSYTGSRSLKSLKTCYFWKIHFQCVESAIRQSPKGYCFVILVETLLTLATLTVTNADCARNPYAETARIGLGAGYSSRPSYAKIALSRNRGSGRRHVC